MKKRIMSFVLAVILCLAILSPAYAVETAITPQQAADYLYEQGLFKGAGTGQDGEANSQPNYELTRAANRAEGVTMLVRLLGKNDEAQKNVNTYKTPFTDVPSWAKPYVGYAYTHGLTNGTSPTTFSPDKLLSSAEYLTLMLRALGYTSGTDFQWDKAQIKALEIGLINPKEYTDNTAAFLRGNMAVISYNALFTRMKNSNQTLGEYLGIRWKDNNESELVGDVVEVDAGDSNNLWDDGNGGYMLSMDNIPDGTIITRDDLIYTAGASTNNNLSNFVTILNEINPNLSWSGKGINYTGKTLTYITAVNGVWNLRISNWSDGKNHRNLFATSLAYFGNKGMASAVYGMIDEHYTKRNDFSTPIPESMANNYGLTITSEVVSESGRISIRVTNGPSTWTITYDVDNDLGSKEVIVKIDLW